MRGFMLTVLFAIAVAEGSSSATQYRYGGATCLPTADAAAYTTNSGTMANPVHSSDRSFYCPVDSFTITNASSITDAKVFYKDSSSQDPEPVYCLMTALNESFSLWTVVGKYSCSTAGGCASGGGTFTGTGYLEWTNPFSNPTTALASVAFGCTLPGNGGGDIIGYAVTY